MYTDATAVRRSDFDVARLMYIKHFLPKKFLRWYDVCDADLFLKGICHLGLPVHEVDIQAESLTSSTPSIRWVRFEIESKISFWRIQLFFRAWTRQKY